MGVGLLYRWEVRTGYKARLFLFMVFLANLPRQEHNHGLGTLEQTIIHYSVSLASMPTKCTQSTNVAHAILSSAHRVQRRRALESTRKSVPDTIRPSSLLVRDNSGSLAIIFF